MVSRSWRGHHEVMACGDVGVTQSLSHKVAAQRETKRDHKGDEMTIERNQMREDRVEIERPFEKKKN